MTLKNLCTALLLGFLSTNAVATVTPGTYGIVNRVSAPRGPPLAITLSGANSPPVVSAKTASLTQKWIIGPVNAGGVQTIRSASEPSLELGHVEKTLTALPAGSQSWEISQTPDGFYRIQTPGGTSKWAIMGTSSGSWVTVGTESGQRGEWIIEAN